MKLSVFHDGRGEDPAGRAGAGMDARHLPAIPVVSDPFTDRMFRVIDVIVSGLLLAILFPLLAAIAIAVRLDSPGSVLFRQRRCGLGLEHFTIAKFRTMVCDAEADAHRDYVLGFITGDAAQARQGSGENGVYKLQADPRVTRVGAFLRRFSLDELPQLWNILCGDMALVGPRPPIPYEVGSYPPEWRGRLSVKPGLTGLWQVSGRNTLDYAQMVAIDLDYVKRRSVRLNLLILLRTGWVVMRGRGAV